MKTTAVMPRRTRLQRAAFCHSVEDQNRLIRVFAEADRRPFTPWSHQLASCTLFGWWTSDPTPESVRLHIHRCRHRLCTLCGAFRAAIAAHKIRRIIARMARPRVMVLTLKGKPDWPREQLNRLVKCFRRLRETPEWKRYVTGGVYALELVINVQTQVWHPHLHAIIGGAYLPVALLKTLWHAATGDSFIVSVQALRSKKNAAAELAKYVGKVQKLDRLTDAQVLQYALAVSRRPMVKTFGDMHGIGPLDKLPRDPDSKDAWRVSIARVVALAHAGFGTAQRIVGVAADDDSRIASYIAHEFPDFIFSQRTLTPEDHADNNRLLFELFATFARESAAGDYANFDQFGPGDP